MILFLLFIGNIFASTPQSWFSGTLEIVLVESPKKGLINPSCLNNEKCLAYKALKDKIVGIPGPEGMNPGSAICTDNYKGSVVMAKKNKSTQALCLFPDGTYASLDGLFL